MRNFKTISIAFGVLLMALNAFADEFVSYEIARVVKVDPIGNMKAYSVPRMSCTNVEPVEGVGGPVQTQQQKCVSYSDREFRYNVIAFNVTFEYKGQVRTVRLDHDPGNTINIKTVTRVYAIE
jgi:uncharacterized protein YcfJ